MSSQVLERLDRIIALLEYIVDQDAGQSIDVVPENAPGTETEVHYDLPELRATITRYRKES